MNTRTALTTAALATVIALTLAACGGTDPAAPTVTVTAATTSEASPAAQVTVTATATPEPNETAAAEDPYELYLEQNPDPDLVLSREDANARAFLGCGTEWGAGTVDALLQELYQPNC